MADVPIGAQQMMRRHMENYLHQRLDRYLALKPNRRPGTYFYVVLDWTERDHLFFFQSLEPIHVHSDEELWKYLAPVSKQPIWKRIGHRKNENRLQICGKGLIRRTSSNKTTVFFTYTRLDKVDGQFVDRWVRPIGNPWDKRQYNRK